MALVHVNWQRRTSRGYWGQQIQRVLAWLPLPWSRPFRLDMGTLLDLGT